MHLELRLYPEWWYSHTIPHSTLLSWLRRHIWQLGGKLFDLRRLPPPLLCLTHRKNLSMKCELRMTWRRWRTLRWGRCQCGGRRRWLGVCALLLPLCSIVLLLSFIFFITVRLFFLLFQSLFLFPLFRDFLYFCVAQFRLGRASAGRRWGCWNERDRSDGGGEPGIS